LENGEDLENKINDIMKTATRVKEKTKLKINLKALFREVSKIAYEFTCYVFNRLNIKIDFFNTFK